ncbi:MAG: hypothetical protein M3167_06195 [Acidobacteriota bacterium]|nr:hypothetical protein [Acidobacteriota bacterium]MDQ6892255.1 hypothetical protein [Acidobacteriota bacterium]
MNLLRRIFWWFQGLEVPDRIEADNATSRTYRGLRRIATSRGEHAKGGGVHRAALGS